MARAEPGATRFVRALLPNHIGYVEGGVYAVQRIDRVVRLNRARAAQLAANGVLTLTEAACIAGPRARDWLVAQGPTSTSSRVAPAAIAPDVSIGTEF